MKQQMILYIDLMVVVGLVFWLLLSYEKRKKESQTNYYLKLQKSIMDQHYMVLQNQITMTRRLRHDLSNHMQTMESLEQSGMTEEYLKYEEQLKELYSVLKMEGFCNNYVLDAMLARRKKQCERQGILFETMLFTVDGAGMEQTDLMIVFYELLEYGTKRADSSTLRFLSLEGNQKNGYLFLRLTCPAPENQTDRRFQRILNIQLPQSITLAKKYAGELHGELEKNIEKIFFTVKAEKEP